MYLKLIGAMIIMFCCGGLGFRIAYDYTRETSILQQLISILDYMECELQYHLTPLPDLCRQAASEQNGVLSQVFLKLSHELENQIFPDVDSCMYASLISVTNVPNSTEDLLKQLGRSLGRFDIDGQLKGLESVRQNCRQKLKHLKENKLSHLRGYQTLGICTGAALVILFI